MINEAINCVYEGLATPEDVDQMMKLGANHLMGPLSLADLNGFVVNRVLVPMINEAINCVYEGLATPEDVDQMMKLGANHLMGPLSLADLIGLDIVLDIMETLYNGFDDSKYRPSSLLKQMCDAGYPGRKTGKGFFS